ncbi:DNA repair protein RadA [Corynebacterium sp. NPDC060344]|uniref:DNA repair protein RadA n=1 Tax=Corynebacterium sp. NPDC060344 TaxID=3347101 RepID=UPI00364B075F
MAKGPSYRCSACGWRASKWVGQCPSCGEWGSLAEAAEPVGRARSAGAAVSSASGLPVVAATPITGVDPGLAKATPTGIGELDRVLGRGVVPGSVVLLAGEPGVGKSTLLLEVAFRCASGELGPALYVTGEESVGQVRLRAERTGALHDELYLAAESDVGEVIEQALAVKPGLLVVDSVQTMQAAGVEGTRGGVAQARAVTAALTALAKESGIAILLVGHVTKDGTVAGPRTMEHLVDVVLNFEGDRHSGLRFLRGLKNRFGATDEVGCFEQTADGIREVEDPSGLFLHHRSPTPGTAVTVAMEGRRPMLAEVQGLVVTGEEAKGNRRNVSGLDQRRVPMVAAIVAQHGTQGMKMLAARELYVATVGGMTLLEPSADLAVGVALASAVTQRPVRENMVVIGELGLAGEVRRVPDIGRRLKEAARMGFTRAAVPRETDSSQAPKGLRLVRVGTIAEAIEAALG